MTSMYVLREKRRASIASSRIVSYHELLSACVWKPLENILEVFRSTRKSLCRHKTTLLLLAALCAGVFILTSPQENAGEGSSPIEIISDFIPMAKPRIAYRTTGFELPEDEGRIVYNRVPKCGSSAVESVISYLTVVNNFTYYRSKIFRDPIIPVKEQRELAATLAKLPTPFIYDRHAHWMDFKKYGRMKPIFINLIREPIEQRVSAYYYRRTHEYNQHKDSKWLNQTFDECVAHEKNECVGQYSVSLGYICGQEPICNALSDASLEQAKRNLEHEYAVVGLTEDIEAFMYVLARLLPRYFNNAQDVYEPLKAELQMKYRTPNRGDLSPETRARMESILRHEIELYNFARQKFYARLTSLQKYEARDRDETDTIGTSW